MMCCIVAKGRICAVKTSYVTVVERSLERVAERFLQGVEHIAMWGAMTVDGVVYCQRVTASHFVGMTLMCLLLLGACELLMLKGRSDGAIACC